MSVNQGSDSGTERGRLDKQDGEAADWQAAGGRGADCDPKDVAWMVEGYVIEREEERERGRERRNNEDASSSQQNPGVCCEHRTFKAVVRMTRACRLSHKQTNDGWIRGGGDGGLCSEAGSQ